MRTVQSFLSMEIVPRAANGAEVINAATANTVQGVSRCFSRLVIRYAGQEVENNQFYHDFCNWHYSTLSLGKKRMLTKWEGRGTTDAFANGRKKFIHPIVSGLFMTDQAIPLPIFQNSSGFQVELFLSPVQEVFTSSNVSYYEITPKYNYLAVTPQPVFTAALRGAVAQGKSMYTFFQTPQWGQSNGNGSMQQVIQIDVNQCTSIESFELGFYDDAQYADQTKDKALRWGNAYLKEWRAEFNGMPNPNQLSFGYAGGYDPALVAINFLSQTGNIYSLGDEVYIEDNFETQTFRIGYSFTSETEYSGTGLQTLGANSPYLTVYTNHSQVVPNTTRILWCIVKSRIIEFRGSIVGVSDIF
ncbi:hypothetical protein HDV00_008954 [Rhizophlyctis rosea]|nr:hypothetical protein HDV00_008954 [Rhizophlyctis rosea]